MKNKINLKIMTIFLVLTIYLTAMAAAFGVSSPVWEGNPLPVAPGESNTAVLTLQNTASDTDVTVRAVLSRGNEIASLEEKDYLVKAGTKNTKIPVTVSIPQNTPIGTTYKVTVSFATVTSGESGGVALGTAIDTTFDVLVSEPTPIQLAPEQEKSNLMYYIIGIILILIIIIAIIITIKKRKKK